VTLGGDSAGAASVTLQLTAYGGYDFGWFHATAAESQSFGPVLKVQEAQYQYDALVKRAGCSGQNDTLACLRSLDATKFQSINYNIPYPGQTQAPLYMYGPVIDGDIIKDYTIRMFEQGKFIKVPAIYG
jgi:carboxylesterase type B